MLLRLYIIFILVLCLHIALWAYGRDLSAKWDNVLPAPEAPAAALTTLGDEQLAYRFYGMMLQNLGNLGGHYRPLKNYNYKRLRGWFETMDRLDPRANFIPTLAAYYFGATQNAEQLDYVIPYLRRIGQRDHGDKWRWLAHAVYLARYRQDDLDLALRIAKELSNNYRDDMPEWVKRMPASIHVAKGDKQAAIDFMLSILKSRGNKLAPGEVQVMRHYLCERILDTQKARTEAICKEIYENNGD